MLALFNNEPRNLGIKRALQIYIEHRYDVIVRRSNFELDKLRARAHQKARAIFLDVGRDGVQTEVELFVGRAPEKAGDPPFALRGVAKEPVTLPPATSVPVPLKHTFS